MQRSGCPAPEPKESGMTDTARPYEGLAAIYDYVMRHVDYTTWADYVDQLISRYVGATDSVIDIACGTGSVTLELCALGRSVERGVDQSEFMLRVARERAMKAGYDIIFEARDMRELEGLGPFDAAVCMYDSLNYMLEPDDVRSALRAVHDILLPGGLFVFDVCTERNSLRYFQDMRDRESGPGFEYERHSRYVRSEHLQINDFVLHFEQDDTRLLEHHVQRIYPLGEIRRAIADTDFDLLGSFDGFTFAPGTEESERVHYALRRRGFSEDGKVAGTKA